MPDIFKVFTTNEPDVEREVDEAELVDLGRQGLLVLGKGDISASGRLKRQVAADTAPEVNASLTPAPTYSSPTTDTV